MNKETINCKPLTECRKKSDDWEEGLKIIKESWNTHYGIFQYEDHISYETIELKTGGWSENEEIINKLLDTTFWMLYWQKSERGGKYTFKRRFGE